MNKLINNFESGNSSGVGNSKSGANAVTIWFLTQNAHKVSEGKEALKNYPRVRLEQLNVPKHEDKDDSLPDAMKEIAVAAAVNGAKEYNRMVVAEDAGIFFEAFNDFPGMNTKWIMNKIGYDGILALLNGKNRKAYFRTVLALASPDGNCKVFEGIVRGEITDKVYGEDVDCMDYDRIFAPEESDVPFALMMGDKTHMSHRYRAFCKLGEYLSGSDEK